MKRIVIVSTFRNRGTKNIGDRLITHSLKKAIRRNYSEDEVDVEVVFRAAPWSEVMGSILGADHVFLACLAIRNRLGEKIYPYMRELMDSGVPYSVLAAGTDLPVKDSIEFDSAIDEESKELLRRFGAGATVFTTRGILSQRFCRRVGVDSAVYAGDVAFYAPEMQGKSFGKPTRVRNIVISDPHRADKYIDSFSTLLEGVREIFPQSLVKVALHGVNEEIRDYCATHDVRLQAIYAEPETGLSIYDQCDLHVGYRVHGHVSALNRRVPSYLLEQDGRGGDYGLTLSRKISVPNFLQSVPHKEGRGRTLRASVAAPQQLLSIMEQDVIDGFSRFDGFGSELDVMSRRVEQILQTTIGKQQVTEA